MRAMPSAFMTYFSNTGSLLPMRILSRKYFSKATLARCTHLPTLAQVTLHLVGAVHAADPGTNDDDAFHDRLLFFSVRRRAAAMVTWIKIL